MMATALSSTSNLESHLKFHHLGLAVRRPDQAIAFARALGYNVGEAVFDPEQNVNLAMCIHKSEPAIELIWPGTGKGPIDALVQRHASGIIYHTCYATEDVAAALGGFETNGITPVCISPPKPAILFGGKKVSFYNIPGMGLVEILE
jgi:methylmalonyl-CoA/ethylmalonyl-CoA epimerase